MTQKRTEHGQEVIRYNRIDKNIYIGTNQCCQMHFDAKLLKKGVNADISLEEKRVDAPFGVKSYLWLPTQDHTPPTRDQLLLGAQHIQMLIQQKRIVYVHCKNGHGRAPTLVAAYYIFIGKTAEEAINFVHRKRTGSHIEKNQQAALKKFENSL